MADIIKCPVCGESNLPNQEFCQYCQSRLQPPTGPLKGTNAPITPGQSPTKKNTADLEPILPEWLRDARAAARQSAEEDATQAARQTPSTQADSEPDLLAGLRSQTGDENEDDVPDWLTSITGIEPKSKKGPGESSEGRRVELGGTNEFAHDQPASEGETPSWLAGLQITAQGSEKDEMADWFRQASGMAQEPQPPSDDSGGSSQPPAQDHVRSDVEFNQGPDYTGDTPDWLHQMAAENNAQANAPVADSSEPFNAPSTPPSDAPDWLRALGGQDQGQGAGNAVFSEPALGGTEAASSSAIETPDWLKGLQGEQQAETFKGETPSWLKEESAGTPAWLSGTQTPAPTPEAEPEPSQFGDVPDWLKAAAPQSSIYKESPAEQQAPVPGETPDWLGKSKTESAAPPESFSAFQKESPAESTPATFTPDTSGNNMDGLFTEMPDWLSNATEQPVSSTPTPITSSDAISPGELPSWVQAMRPVDPGAPQTVPPSGAQTFEQRGALAGLQGVLPAVPGYAPSSKPKAYSIKIQASHEQQAHAALLEQILAAEASPVPIASFSPLRASRGLRWSLTAIIFIALFAIVILRTQIFSMPVGAPRELNSALQVAQGIPESAPVLVAVDYQPSRVGEMEAAAAPIFDQIILLKHPRLTIISTNEEGPLLVERLFTGPLAGHGYQSGLQYLNLGYLAGGTAGIRAFAEEPAITAPFDASLAPAWTSAPLQGVTSLSQFAALFIVTDDAGSARAWIEQTTGLRGTMPVVVISSAQATPMIQPYYASGQINGIVSGLYGGAMFEQNNAGRPGTARTYWDAYSVGMLIAMVVILIGGLWNLALGVRDRAEKRERN